MCASAAVGFAEPIPKLAFRQNFVAPDFPALKDQLCKQQRHCPAKPTHCRQLFGKSANSRTFKNADQYPEIHKCQGHDVTSNHPFLMLFDKATANGNIILTGCGNPRRSQRRQSHSENPSKRCVHRKVTGSNAADANGDHVRGANATMQRHSPPAQSHLNADVGGTEAIVSASHCC